MAKNYGELWKGVTSATNAAQAVRTLGEILADKEGRTFISRLGSKDAELCIEILDDVSHESYFPFPNFKQSRQGIAERNLKPAEKQAFFVTLRRLAGHYGRLPESMIITEKIMVSDEVFASSGFADVRPGTYTGHLVAIKTMRVAAQDDLLKIRKVSINVGHPGHGLNHSTPAILQRGGPMEHAIPPERHETCWGLRGYDEGRVCHSVRVDEARKRRGVR